MQYSITHSRTISKWQLSRQIKIPQKYHRGIFFFFCIPVVKLLRVKKES